MAVQSPTAESPHTPSASPVAHGNVAYAPPDPRAATRQLLDESRDLLTLALDALRTTPDLHKAGDLVGRASDRIGSALHFMRIAQRR